MVVHLHMGWRDVCFLNRPVDPAAVADHLPEGLTVDTYRDSAWLSVTPFANVDVRPWFVPRDWGVPLPEINLRTYVVHRDVPGVYFLSLDAEGLAAVLGARAFHRLPYYRARIEFDRGSAHDRGREQFRFESRRTHPGARPARFRGQYEPVGERFYADAGSLARFLTDRERYYTEGRLGELRYADVSHEPWPLYEAEAAVGSNTLFEAAGLAKPDSEPTVLYSPGVDTLATPSRRA